MALNNVISLVMAIIGGVILFLSLLPKNSNFLDIRAIFLQHFKIFKDSPIQITAIFISPIFLSVSIVLVCCVNTDILNNLNIVLSILIAMFFSTLGILCTIDTSKKKDKYIQLLKETFNATIFEISICLIILFISFVMLFVDNFSMSFALSVVSGILYYLTMVAILNVFVVIKRIKVLFDNK